jgi:hypothetical protein
MTLLRGAILALGMTLSTSALAKTYGLGWEQSKDEQRFQNYVYDGRLRFDLDLFAQHQEGTTLYGMSPGFGVSALDTKYFDLLPTFHVNFGVNSTPENEDIERFGARMYYDVGVTPNVKLWRLRATSFLGYRKDHNATYLNPGNIHNDGFVARLGLGLEF